MLNFINKSLCTHRNICIIHTNSHTFSQYLFIIYPFYETFFPFFLPSFHFPCHFLPLSFLKIGWCYVLRCWTKIEYGTVVIMCSTPCLSNPFHTYLCTLWVNLLDSTLYIARRPTLYSTVHRLTEKLSSYKCTENITGWMK